MKKKKREILAFILNLFPGLGFYFSGTVHNLERLRLLGSGLIATFLIMIPLSVVIVNPRPLINHHFTTSELLLPLTIALTFGTLGAGVEHKIKENKNRNNSTFFY